MCVLGWRSVSVCMKALTEAAARRDDTIGVLCSWSGSGSFCRHSWMRLSGAAGVNDPWALMIPGRAALIGAPAGRPRTKAGRAAPPAGSCREGTGTGNGTGSRDSPRAPG